MNELKPCPFCGGSAGISMAGLRNCIVSCNAGAKCIAIAKNDEVDSAVSKWNTRPLEDSLFCQVDELKLSLLSRDRELAEAYAESEQQAEIIGGHIDAITKVNMEKRAVEVELERARGAIIKEGMDVNRLNGLLDRVEDEYTSFEMDDGLESVGNMKAIGHLLAQRGAKQREGE